MNFIYIYLLESTISISVIYIFYELFLKRDTWFRFNRYYLLFGIIFSLILPFLDFSASKIWVSSQNQFEFQDFLNISNTVNLFEQNTLPSISSYNYMLGLYILTVIVFFVRFLIQFVNILKTIKTYEIIKYRNYKLVLIDKDCGPFSFLNYIFISKTDYGSIGAKELIIHEITHVKQKHSFDIILLELLLVLQWFNPFIYRYRLAIKEVHEYLADRGVLLQNRDKIAYQKLILDQIEKNFRFSLASQFNYSLTKNRIKMMTRINSGKISKLKILLVLPLIAILISAFTVDTVIENKLIKTQLYYVQPDSDIPSIFPVKKVDGVKTSSGYGMRMHPIKKEKMMHNAVDIKAPEGTPVFATANGLVRKVKQDFKKGEGYGRYIIIDHENGFSTLYAQLSGYNVKEGQEVQKGDIIGYVGQSGLSTGPHLHYEVMKDGENVNPENYF